jgi:bifunctional DNA-binding transcriptional regulator/antitoxin component of YhaV-PrlF toxin-antitoxin module
MSLFLSTLTSKGQTTVPDAVRKALGLTTGRRIVWELRPARPGSELQLVVRPGRPLSALAGSLASDMPFAGIEAEKAATQSLRAAHLACKYRTK